MFLHDFCLPSQKFQALTMEAPRAPSPSLEEPIIFQVKLPFGGVYMGIPHDQDTLKYGSVWKWRIFPTYPNYSDF